MKSKVAVIMLTGSCNMSCRFCITDQSVSSMTYDQAVSLLYLLQKNGFSNIVLGGGEPFLWKYNVVRLSKQAHAMGFIVQVGTNGTRLPDDFAQISTIDRYVLPLDSMDEKTHNALRHYPSKDHYSVIIKRLSQLKDHQKQVTVSSVVMRPNLEHVEKIGEFLESYTKEGGLIHAWHLYRFIPEGRGGLSNASRLWIEKSEYDKCCQKIREANTPFYTFKRGDMYRSRSVGFFWYADDQFKFKGMTSHPTVKTILSDEYPHRFVECFQPY